MTNFKQILGSFLSGEIEYSQLGESLVSELTREPDATQEVLQLVNSLHASGRLPTQLHQSLLREIQALQRRPPTDSLTPIRHAAPDSADEEEDDGKTRIVVRTPARPVSMSGDSWKQSDSGTGPGQSTGPTGQSGPSSSSWSSPDHWPDTVAGAPKVGTILKGRFILESIIGEGGMGIVFKAKDLRKEEAQDRHPYVAIKILNETFKQHPESLKALQREARKAQQLAHPNIVNVFDFDRSAGNVFMTMELMDGEPLDCIFKRNVSLGMPLSEAMPMIRDMGNGLAFAHDRGTIHSDFKPANAFLTKDGVVKVFDFGIARAAQRSDQADGEMTLFDAGTLGALTPAYATIGMIEGDEPDRRDDIYALACVVYELLSGKHPFKKRSALQARNASMVPMRIDSLNRRQWRTLQKALSFKRARQPVTVKEFIGGLEPRKINRTQLAVGGVAALLLLAFMANWVPSYVREWQLNSLIKTLQSGTDNEIELIIGELGNELTREEQSIVYRNNESSTVALFDYFQRAIDNAIGTDQDDARQLNIYDYPKAEAVIEIALTLFPDSVAVADKRDKIDARKKKEIADQTGRLNVALQNQILLESQGPGSAEEVLGIMAAVNPGDELLTDRRLSEAFANQARTALTVGDHQSAQALVTLGISIAPADSTLLMLSSAVEEAIGSAEFEADRQFNIKVQGMLDEIKRLAQSGRFTPPNENAAEEKMQALANAGADVAILAAARQAIMVSYLQLARRARDDGQFDSARTLANLVSRHNPDSTMADLLRQELADIEAAQIAARQLASAKRSSQPAVDAASDIESLRRQFLTRIKNDNLTLDEGRALVNLVDRLQILRADGDIVNNGRDQIAQALLNRALTYRDAGEWDDALGMAAGTVDLLPDSNSARSVAAMLERDYEQVRANQSEQRNPLAENRLEQLMAQSSVDLAWLEEVLLVRGETGMDAAAEKTSNEEIATRLSVSINNLASTDQFSEARALLDRGAAIWPDSVILLAAGNKLKVALDEFEQRTRASEEAEQQQVRNQAVEDPDKATISNEERTHPSTSGTTGFATTGVSEGLLGGGWRGVQSGGSGYLQHEGNRLYGSWKKTGFDGRVDLTVRNDGKLVGAMMTEWACSYKEKAERVVKVCTIQNALELTQKSEDRLEGRIRLYSEPRNPLAATRACRSCYESEVRNATWQRIGWERTDSVFTLASESVSAKNSTRSDKTGIETRKLKQTHFVAPDYPRSAERRGIIGWVRLSYGVTTAGETADIKVEESEPRSVFDDAAIEAVEQWRYDPAIENYEIVQKRYTVRLNFDLE